MTRITGTAIVIAASCIQAFAADAKPLSQSKCPIMGGTIDKTNYADVNGYRIYVCCPGCLAKVKADPDAALAKIRANGETPEPVPVAICGKCGQIKGSDLCCKPGQEKCVKCGLVDGTAAVCIRRSERVAERPRRPCRERSARPVVKGVRGKSETFPGREGVWGTPKRPPPYQRSARPAGATRPVAFSGRYRSRPPISGTV